MSFRATLDGWLNTTTRRKQVLFSCACVDLLSPHLSTYAQQKLEWLIQFADTPEIEETLEQQAASQPEAKPLFVFNGSMLENLHLPGFSATAVSEIRANLNDIFYGLSILPHRNAARTAQEVAYVLLRIQMGPSGFMAEGDPSSTILRTYISPVLNDLANPTLWKKLPASVIRWEDFLIFRSAAVMYQNEDFESLPVLADALEEAGSTDTDLITHLRSPGPHWRGCWALDKVLKK